MNFFRKSVVFKLWLAMVTLVLIITWVTSMVQTNSIEKLYYRQQIDHISRQGYDIAGAISSGDNIREKIILLSNMTNTNIMLIDRDGFIEECHGMGMNMTILGDQGQRVSVLGHHGDLITDEDMKKILAGESRVFRGINQAVKTEVLSVAVPVTTGGGVSGAVIVSHSMADIESQMSDFQKIIVNVGMGGIILATFLSLLFSRSLSRPLIQMNNVALALSGGDFSRRVEVKAEDEIGVLAESLNKLSDELQEKIAALEKLDQTRKDFVAGVSHEIRTPLAIIQGYAEALQDGVAGSEEEQKQCIDGIVKESGRLKRLISDLLDLRRIESGMECIEIYDFDPIPVITESVDKMRTLADRKGVDISLETGGDIPWVRANPDRLEQVMINLIENALRFTPPGGTITVKIAQEGRLVRVMVSDSGPGVSADQQDLIWEKFYKVDKSRARNDSGGTGLGLATVKRLVERMGGEVGVESAPGKGATFTFTLRLKL
ncbi:MAG: sensor histidine kinase [Bacillota bacterium]